MKMKIIKWSTVQPTCVSEATTTINETTQTKTTYSFDLTDSVKLEVTESGTSGSKFSGKIIRPDSPPLLAFSELSADEADVLVSSLQSKYKSDEIPNKKKVRNLKKIQWSTEPDNEWVKDDGIFSSNNYEFKLSENATLLISDCYSIPEIGFTGSVKHKMNHDHVFFNKSLEYADSQIALLKAKYAVKETDVTFDDEVIQCDIVNIIDTDIETITITGNVKEIEAFAFYEFKNIKEVFYEGSIYSWCNIKINNSYANPMKNANKFYFMGDDGTYILLEDLVFPEQIKDICPNTFSGFSCLKTATIPNVNSIEEGAFEACDNLHTLTIGDESNKSTIVLHDSSFSECCSLKNINIYANVFCTGMTNRPFGDNNEQRQPITLTFGDNVKYIDSNVYRNLETLEHITVGKNVEHISGGRVSRSENEGFEKCKNLKTITNNSILHMFPGCNLNQYVSKNAKTVKDWRDKNFIIFEENYDKRVISYIGDDEEVLIPSGTTHVGPYAFSNLENIDTIDIPSTICSVDKLAFKGLKSVRVVRCHKPGILTQEHFQDILNEKMTKQ